MTFVKVKVKQHYATVEVGRLIPALLKSSKAYSKRKIPNITLHSVVCRRIRAPDSLTPSNDDRDVTVSFRKRQPWNGDLFFKTHVTTA